MLTEENLGTDFHCTGDLLKLCFYADFTVLQEIHHNVEIFHTQEFWQQRLHTSESLQGSAKQMVP